MFGLKSLYLTRETIYCHQNEMLFFPVIGKGPQCGLLFLYGAVANAASRDSRASFNDDAGVRMLSLQVFF